MGSNEVLYTCVCPNVQCQQTMVFHSSGLNSGVECLKCKQIHGKDDLTNITKVQDALEAILTRLTKPIDQQKRDSVSIPYQ